MLAWGDQSHGNFLPFFHLPSDDSCQALIDHRELHCLWHGLSLKPCSEARLGSQTKGLEDHTVMWGSGGKMKLQLLPNSTLHAF